MKFFLKPQDPSKLDVDTLILFCWKNELNALKNFNSELTDLITHAMQKEEFTGEEKQLLILSTKGYIGAYKLIVCGLGTKEEIDLLKLRSIVALTVKRSKEMKSAKVALVLDDFLMKKFTVHEAVEVTVEAVILSAYRFNKYKSEEEKKKFRDIDEVILSIPAGKISSAEYAVEMGEKIALATCMARDLVNEPSAVTTPAFLASFATSLAKQNNGSIKVRIFEKEEIEKLGMSAYLGVAKGSDEPPKFIHLSYKPPRFKKKIVLIGKGITFDTGGLSLKSSEHMETMKLDMAGAAAVLAVFSVLPQLHVSSHVVGLIAACENMPSGKALKPGDILQAQNGKTIEVLNTDAEGRLTLADALSFAVSREKPDEIIDLATLTGACMIALGQEIAGLWSNNEALASKIINAAKKGGENIWRMPLESEYKDLIKSDIADLKNTQTGRYGGAITAALFLSEFVSKTPWAHLDIAGPSFNEKESPLVPKGGSGFGVRLLLQLLTES